MISRPAQRRWPAGVNPTVNAKLPVKRCEAALYSQSIVPLLMLVTGVATAIGVQATARQAYEQGFNVTLAIDAMTDLRLQAHDYSIANVFPRLGETGTTQAILDLLQRS